MYYDHMYMYYEYMYMYYEHILLIQKETRSCLEQVHQFVSDVSKTSSSRYFIISLLSFCFARVVLENIAFYVESRSLNAVLYVYELFDPTHCTTCTCTALTSVYHHYFVIPYWKKCQCVCSL